jgi:diamine N-acetyltransferase
MIVTDHLILRSLEEADLEARVKWFNDPEINQYLVSDFPMGLAKTKRWFQSTLLDVTKLNLSIVDRTSGQLIGMTGLLNINQKNAHAQFYITIGDSDFHGQGFPQEIIPAVLNHGFTYLRLNKIYLWTLLNNTRARKVYERNGFKEEATLLDFLHCRGDFQDIIQHCVLRKDFMRNDAS